MAPISMSDKFPTPDMFHETVVVRVGPAASSRRVKCSAMVKTFTLHKRVLCFYSGYFETALKDDTWKESKTGTFELPTEDIDTFEHFVGWMYTRVLPTKPTGEICNFEPLCHLWALADRRDIPLLMNLTIDAIRDELVRTWRVPTGALHYIWANTTAVSGLRRLLAKLLSVTGGPDMLDDRNLPNWPPDAVVDIARLLWQMKEDGVILNWTDSQVAELDLCEYHVHEKGVKCEKKKKEGVKSESDAVEGREEVAA